MQKKVQKIIAFSILALAGTTSLKAQTISTLDDLTLPGVDTNYASSLGTAQDYSFQSGNISFHGTLESWGGYDAFNFSNTVDTTNSSYTNDKAVIAGKGYNGSANYGVAYTASDYPANPTHSLLIGAKLKGAAVGSKVLGAYFTNLTYPYLYMKDNYHTGDSMTLIIRGYLNNTLTADSVVFDLAKYTSTDTILVKNWQWVNLIPLGNVDSLSFQIVSSDDFTPYYFAFDNMTTLDGVCPKPINALAASVNENSATINWINGIENLPTSYQIAVDQSNTLAPTATTTTVTATTYAAASLNPNTNYYAHLRAACPDGGFSDWDTTAFKTLQGTGINETAKNNLNLSIHPNPATSIITIACDKEVNVSIYSIEGKQQMTATHAKTIDISALASGVYYIKAVDISKNYSSTLRFIKQ